MDERRIYNHSEFVPAKTMVHIIKQFVVHKSTEARKDERRMIAAIIIVDVQEVVFEYNGGFPDIVFVCIISSSFVLLWGGVVGTNDPAEQGIESETHIGIHIESVDSAK